MKARLFALGALLLAAGAVWAEEERGLPVFSDSFDSVGTFAENWVSEQCTSEGGVVKIANGGSMHWRGKQPLEFCAEADITVLPCKGAKDDSQCWGGFSLEYASFYIRPSGGSFFLWKLPSDKNTNARYVKIPDFVRGKSAHFKVVRKVRTGGVKVVFSVNGAKIGEFIAPTPMARKSIDGRETYEPLKIGGYSVDLVVDNFRLSTVRRGEESPNMIYNSGFEYGEDGVPTYYGLLGSFNYAERPPEEYETRYLKRFALDSAEKHSGKYSLRVQVNDASGSISIAPWQTGTIKGQPGVFSLWMKASVNGLPVRIQYSPKEEDGWKVVKVSKKWKRYEVTRLKLGASGITSLVHISPEIQKGKEVTLWLDDLQAEVVELKPEELSLDDEDEPQPLYFNPRQTYATAYRPSDLDRERLGPGSVKSAVPEGDSAGNGCEVNAKDEVLGRLDYYMNEPYAAWRVTGADGKVAVVKKPLSEIPAGTNRVTFAANGKTYTDVVVKLPFQKGATQVNRWARCLVKNGENILFTAPDLGSVGWFGWKPGQKTYKTMMDVVALGGFRHVAGLMGAERESFGQDNQAQNRLVLDELRAHGFQYMNWSDQGIRLWENWVEEPGPRIDPNAFLTPTEMVAFFRPYADVILTNLVIDEPELNKESDWTRCWLEYMKAFYPYLPVQMNNSCLGVPRRFADLKTDVLMLDDYLTNAEGRTVESVVRQIDVLRAVPGGKPCWYFIVANNASLHYKSPSYAEQLAMSWGCILAGCTGIAWYHELPVHEGTWRAMKQVNREAQALKDVILSEELCAPTTADQPKARLRHLTRTLNGQWHVLACNIDVAPLGKVTFALPEGAPRSGTVEVLFENRTLPLKDGVFSDDFAPHTRHLYKIR